MMQSSLTHQCNNQGFSASTTVNHLKVLILNIMLFKHKSEIYLMLPTRHVTNTFKHFKQMEKVKALWRREAERLIRFAADSVISPHIVHRCVPKWMTNKKSPNMRRSSLPHTRGWQWSC